MLLVIKSVLINAMSGGARMRVKAYPRTDVYHKGQRACCVYIRGFRTDMFRIENSAVGNDFNQITFFLSSSSPLQSIVALKNSLFLSYKIQNNCCRASLSVCHFLPWGECGLSTSSLIHSRGGLQNAAQSERAALFQPRGSHACTDCDLE